MVMDEERVMGVSEAELEQRLLKLASTIVALKEKILGQVSLNPDYLRYNYWLHKCQIMGVDIKKNKFMYQYLRTLKIKGFTTGIHGSSEPMPFTELSKLTMGISQKDVFNKKSKSLSGIAEAIVFSDSEEKIKNVEKAKKEKLKQEEEDLNKVKQLEKELKELTEKYDIERKKPITIINANQSQEENNEIDSKKSKKDNSQNTDNQDNKKFKSGN